MKHLLIMLTLFIIVLQLGCTQDNWISLFDGKTFSGWQASEKKDSWQIVDGAFVTNGPRSHLFYVGDVQNHNFKNFEFKAEVKTTPASNSGIYFHSEYQETGWPKKGYECQVFNSKPKVQPGQWVERKMTGSLYAICNTWKSPARDNVWFDYHIIVQGKTVRVYINDELITDYTEPAQPFRVGNFAGCLVSNGTFALQCHDPKSTVAYKNIRVKPLPDDLPTPGTPITDPGYEARLISLAMKNFPLVDLHVHLKRGLTMEKALANARKYGFTYGFALNCGLKMGFENEDRLQAYLNTYKKPVQSYLAMQAEGREWQDLFSKEIISKFDYVFTDAMTWTNDNGKRMRLWIKEETEIGDPENFMDQLVQHIEQILDQEPIDIYVNPTYLPNEINNSYDKLWTPERMDRVIKALIDNNIALEINDRYKIPSPAFIKRAKEAGVKFTFGTNNGSVDDLGRLEYCITMAEECGLTPNDMWLPPERE